MEKMNLTLAKKLIESNLDFKEVIKRSGITHAIYFQIKRDYKRKNKKVNFGCVVCSGEKFSKMFCSKHYWTYVEYNRSKNKRKAI